MTMSIYVLIYFHCSFQRQSGPSDPSCKKQKNNPCAAHAPPNRKNLAEFVMSRRPCSAHSRHGFVLRFASETRRDASPFSNCSCGWRMALAVPHQGGKKRQHARMSLGGELSVRSENCCSAWTRLGKLLSSLSCNSTIARPSGLDLSTNDIRLGDEPRPPNNKTLTATHGMFLLCHTRRCQLQWDAP